MRYLKKFCLIAVLTFIFVFSFCLSSFAVCNSMPDTSEDQVNLQSLKGKINPKHLEDYPQYKISDLYLKSDSETKIGAVYAAYLAKRVFIKIVLNPDWTLRPGSLKNQIDWDNDGCQDHINGAVVAKDNSVFMNIKRNSRTAEYFGYVLELIADPGNYLAGAPADFDGKLKIVFSGDDSVGGHGGPDD